MKTLLILGLQILLTVCVAAEEVSITVENHDLKGTLIPSPKGKDLAVMIVSGSGPTDRDGNTTGVKGKNNSLKYLAEALHTNNIATLRCDKRGVGGSLGAGVKEEELRFDTYINDVVAWVQFLHTKGYRKVVLLGHSEGALVATVAAQKSNIAGLVLIAGAGRPAQDILRAQLKPQLSEKDYSRANQLLIALSKGHQVQNSIPALHALFRPSVQPYLISWFKFDPAKELAKIKSPVLIIQGSTDIQTSTQDAQKLHTEAKGSQIEIIEGMNHILKRQDGDLKAQMKSYTDPSLPLHPDLVPKLDTFIRAQVKK
ncbi:alpha/beta hydrolase [Oceaniferula spumae]|uniref:Alpha/beta hydrolase n=1 Tax=Oceaniferula spumae TaxID=2979115 RepID=A0AAT9FHS8_9BACT